MSEDKKIITEDVSSFPITSPQIMVRNQGLEMIIEETIKYWHENFPEERKIFLTYDIPAYKQNKLNENAMSASGELMLKGLIPPRLKKALGNMLIREQVLSTDEAKNWEKIPELINIFFKIFKEGCVNETSDLR